jgi:pimeloyl-ACP methyl ester carboxylesterase
MKLAVLAATALPLVADAASAPRTYILDGIWGFHVRWEGLRSRLEREVGPSRIWHYNNSGLVSLETLGKELAAELEKVDGPVNLIGYSMGGLVVREALRQSPNLKIRGVVLMHTPNDGSLNGHILPMLPACREMQPGSNFLRRLADTPWDRPTFVTWCPYDLMVFPGKSACWPKATETLRCDMPMHNWPVMSRSVHSAVVKFLNTERTSVSKPVTAQARTAL